MCHLFETGSLCEWILMLFIGLNEACSMSVFVYGTLQMRLIYDWGKITQHCIKEFYFLWMLKMEIIMFLAIDEILLWLSIYTTRSFSDETIKIHCFISHLQNIFFIFLWNNRVTWLLCIIHFFFFFFFLLLNVVL